jgi:hypothetical protein
MEYGVWSMEYALRLSRLPLALYDTRYESCNITVRDYRVNTRYPGLILKLPVQVTGSAERVTGKYSRRARSANTAINTFVAKTRL